MQANIKFKHMDLGFWAQVRLISEKLKYTIRIDNNSTVKAHTAMEIQCFFDTERINYTERDIDSLVEYFNYRADTLNNFVEPNLMNAEQAKLLFEKLDDAIQTEYNIKMPYAFNKQSNEKKKIAYLTAIIDILTTRTLFEINPSLSYVKDPRNLTTVLDENNKLLATLSRRFDGAFPTLRNPLILWEIKEYYYTTTFGSRIADGVYETQLDGFEINQLEEKMSHPIYHVFFADAYFTWWDKGKSYLCRLIDALNMGLVDELIFGKEVVERWPIILSKIILQQEPLN